MTIKKKAKEGVKWGIWNPSILALDIEE